MSYLIYLHSLCADKFCFLPQSLRGATERSLFFCLFESLFRSQRDKFSFVFRLSILKQNIGKDC